MKSRTLFYIIFLSLLCACIKDPCLDVFCSEKGECINGKCFCLEKHAGENCVSFAQYFSGTYSVHSNCVDSVYQSVFSVQSAAADTLIFINNLLNVQQTWSVLANIINDSTVVSLTEPTFEDTLNNRIYTINEPFSLKGKPTPNDTLKATITYIINNTETTCTEIYIKQP